MLASLLIVFREVLEAGLIVGIVLAATEGIARRGSWIAGGIAVGVGGAAVLAMFAGAISGALSGNGQEVFNASILIVAVVMLGWHNVWMASHGRQIAQEMRAVGHAVGTGERSLLALAVVVAVAVLREGAEVVLFLYGIAASSQAGAAALMLGGVLGVGAGALVSYLLYRGLIAIPVSRLFSVTSWLIALLAAGMAGQAAAILAGIDLIPAWGYQLWDTSWLLPQNSLPGQALHALVGYSDRPLGVQVVAYLVVLAALVTASRLVNPQSPKDSRAASSNVPHGHRSS
ncbi:MAG: FTR1 family protein [Alphaproteobacteria bacterium]|nr:FTR1 family protein [Alphaproteobacteria bacterium]